MKTADVLIVIAEKNFQDIELKDTKETIEKARFTTIIASKTAGAKKGVFGGTAMTEIALAGVNVSDYKAIVFIGGGGASQYFNDSKALKIAGDAAQKGKIVAAICIAPVILANAGVLKGKKATVWDDEAGTYSKMIEDKRAIYTANDVEKDGNIITANGPDAAKKFGKAIADAIH